MRERLGELTAHLDLLSVEDRMAIRQSLLELHAGVTADIELIDASLMRTNQPELAFATGIENYEHMLGHAVLLGEIDATEAYEAIGRFE